MPIRSFFRLAGDARKDTVGKSEPSETFIPPHPVSSLKLHPFSRFNSSHSNVIVTSSTPLHTFLATPSIHISLSRTDTNSNNMQRSAHIIEHNHSILDTSDTSSNTITNSHHSCFASTLSKTPPSIPDPIISSCAPKIPFSRFRPSISASNRLSAWASPFALRKRQDLESSLPSCLVDVAFRIAFDSLAPKTKSTYAAGILRFHQFCNSWNINKESQISASPTLLAAFVRQCSGSYSGNTVHCWLAGIRSWHIIHQADWHGDHEWVQKGRITAFKEDTSFKSPLCAPVSLEHLHALLSKLTLSIPFHAAVWAAATITFF